MIWSGAAIERASALWGAGYSAAQISRMLFVELGITASRNAVLGKLHRLGVVSPGSRGPSAPTARRKAPQPQIVAPLMPDATGQTEAVPEPSGADSAVPLLEARGGQCRYPLWDDNERKNFLVCGGKNFIGSYCAFHARLCFSPAGMDKATKDGLESALVAERDSGIKRAFG